jgi:tetratricopeptide (TPR) repeat protein
MPRSIKKITKKSAFKEEEVKDFFTHAIDFIKERRKQAASIASVVLIIVIIAFSIFLYTRSQIKESNIIQAEAFQYYHGQDLPSEMKDEERYKKALGLFKKAEKVSPNSTNQLMIAHCYSQLGDRDNSVKAYNEFIKDNPNSYLLPVAYQKLASDYAKEENIDSALKFLEKLGSYKGGIFKDTALFKEAEIYESQGNKEEAQKRYEEIVNNYPDSLWTTQAQAKARKDEDKKQTAKPKETEKSTEEKAVQEPAEGISDQKDISQDSEESQPENISEKAEPKETEKSLEEGDKAVQEPAEGISDQRDISQDSEELQPEDISEKGEPKETEKSLEEGDTGVQEPAEGISDQRDMPQDSEESRPEDISEKGDDRKDK